VSLAVVVSLALLVPPVVVLEAGRSTMRGLRSTRSASVTLHPTRSGRLLPVLQEPSSQCVPSLIRGI
jgi:hypothetical protein